MPDETVRPESQTPPGTPVAEPSGTPSIDPVEYARLKEFETGARAYLETLAPYEQTIQKYVSDESYRNLVDNAQKSYEAIRQQEDTTPPYIKPLAEKVDRLDKFVGSYEAEQRLAKENQAAQSRIQALGEKYPDLAVDNYKIIKDLGDELAAKNANLPEDKQMRVGQFVDLLETLAPRLVSAAPKRETPPPSLRGDVSTTGVSVTPAPKYEPGKLGLKQRERDITRVIRKAAGGG